jgi:hypothetical protein
MNLLFYLENTNNNIESILSTTIYTDVTKVKQFSNIQFLLNIKIHLF